MVHLIFLFIQLMRLSTWLNSGEELNSMMEVQTLH